MDILFSKLIFLFLRMTGEGDSKVIWLSLMGDVAFRRYKKKTGVLDANKVDVNDPFDASVQSILKDSDLTLANLETAVVRNDVLPPLDHKEKTTNTTTKQIRKIPLDPIGLPTEPVKQRLPTGIRIELSRSQRRLRRNGMRHEGQQNHNSSEHVFSLSDAATEYHSTFPALPNRQDNSTSRLDAPPRSWR